MMNIPIATLIYQLITFSANFVHDELQFRQFIRDYNKSYSLGSSEYWHRFSIFQAALDKINHLNSQRTHPSSALFGLTQFTDLTVTEFKRKVMKTFINRRRTKNRDTNGGVGIKRLLTQSNDLIKSNGQQIKLSSLMKDVPPQIDWRLKGVIGDVIAQGKCGSCWAHTVIETISSMAAIQTDQFVRLSAQQLLDCSDNNFGCNGGDLCEALKWIVANNVTLLTDKEYPLRLESGQCRYKSTKGVHIESNFTCQSEKGHEENMIKLIAFHGPLMAAADASLWQYYVNGTIHDNCGTDANHAVQIVGYNLKDDVPYYIARNTWGTNWGMNGYLQIGIGNNTCDITAEVASVWVKSIDSVKIK